MKCLHDKVNIVPVIAKADTLTKKEVKELKKRILREIYENQIQIYQFPEADEEEDDEEFIAVNKELKVSQWRQRLFLYSMSEINWTLYKVMLGSTHQLYLYRFRCSTSIQRCMNVKTTLCADRTHTIMEVLTVFRLTEVIDSTIVTSHDSTILCSLFNENQRFCSDRIHLKVTSTQGWLWRKLYRCAWEEKLQS